MLQVFWFHHQTSWPTALCLSCDDVRDNIAPSGWVCGVSILFYLIFLFYSQQRDSKSTMSLCNQVTFCSMKTSLLLFLSQHICCSVCVVGIIWSLFCSNGQGSPKIDYLPIHPLTQSWSGPVIHDISCFALFTKMTHLKSSIEHELYQSGRRSNNFCYILCLWCPTGKHSSSTTRNTLATPVPLKTSSLNNASPLSRPCIEYSLCAYKIGLTHWNGG